MPTSSALIAFFIPGFLFTITMETPILLLGLSSRHPIRERAIAGVMLTACTYPIVVLVLPELLRSFGYDIYISIAETFAPLAECVLFYVFWIRSFDQPRRGQEDLRDFAAIIVANLASWLVGGVLAARYLSPLLQ
jgi:hypothetical protein